MPSNMPEFIQLCPSIDEYDVSLTCIRAPGLRPDFHSERSPPWDPISSIDHHHMRCSFDDFEYALQV